MTPRLVVIMASAAIAGLFPPAASRAAPGDGAATYVKGPLPAPDPAANPAFQQQEYRIGPLDTLDITVFNVETLTRTVQVDAKGRFEYPLIGVVDASTKTPAELANEIAGRLGQKYLQSPQVSVMVKQSMSQRFTIEGAVAAPGVYDMQGRMTLMQAIATAHGLGDSAILRDVTIFRVVHQKRMASVINFADVRKGKVDDPEIYPADEIVVPNSATLHALHELVALTPLLILTHP
jgi:polysaccharide export outer membrane protein